MNARCIAALFIALCSTYSLPARAQDASAVVCSTALTTPPSTLSWQNYLSVATSPNEAVDHEQLAKLVEPHALAWPEEIRTPVAAALRAFAAETNPLPATALALSKDLRNLPATQFAFRNQTFQLELPMDATGNDLCDPLQAPARIEAAYVVLLMERANAAVVASGTALTARQISSLEEQYDRYLFEGYPMFPWEAWANSKFLATDTIAQGPPHRAIVLMHPAAGVVRSIESDSRTDSGGTLSVEPFGWIWYSDDYSKWYGVSLLTTFPSDRNAGRGVAFNYNNFKLGVTWHDDDAGHDGLGIFLGMDLMQFLSEKQRKYEGYKKHLGETLRSVGGANE
jgi:hypothetical protein